MPFVSPRQSPLPSLSAQPFQRPPSSSPGVGFTSPAGPRSGATPTVARSDRSRLRRRRAGLLGLPLLLALTGAAFAADSRVRQWGEAGRLEPLPPRQGSTEPTALSSLLLLIRPADLPSAPVELRLTPSPHLDRRSLSQRGKLCRMAWPVTGARPRCLEAWPVQLEPNSGVDLRLPLPRPLEPGIAYGLVLQIRNPSVEGLHPLRLHALSPGAPDPTYIGTWLLEILSQAD